MLKNYIGLLTLAIVLTGCATTEYQQYEARNPIVEGNGGTKTIVDGMEIWDNGDPPRRFKVLGIIEDERGAGIIPMSNLKSDIVKKARAAGGDAVIAISNESQIKGYLSNGTATANGRQVYGSGFTTAVRKHHSKYAVIKFMN